MQTFDKEPSESELAVLLAPESRSWRLQVEDTPERLVARPSGFLVPWGIVSLLVPLAVAAWYLGRKAILEGLNAWDGIGIFIAFLAMSTLLGVFWWLNQAELSKGDFFLLDKIHKTLTICRQKIQFGVSQVVGFVEVRAWHSEENSQDAAYYWLGELTVLVRGEQGQTLRYPLVTSQHPRGIGRVARTLADFFGVELHLLKLDRKTRRRLAQKAK